MTTEETTRPATDRRVQFDFEVDFSNGGGLQGQDFRLDLAGDDLSDQDLADYIVKDLRLLMVGEVRILNKQIIFERHKRSAEALPESSDPSGRAGRFIDLSHTIVEGMVTYKGMPAPILCDFLSREASQSHYAEGTTFQIDRLEMVGNTGTYIDSPFHRYADGKDLSELDLAQLADLDAVVVRVTGMGKRAVDRDAFLATDVRGKAVLVHTGWAQHWGTEQYFEGHAFLTAAAAIYLKEQGAVLVGIDSLNIDDTSGGTRPVHTTLLGAEILIVEHLRGLEQLPTSGFTFSAVPVKVRGMGTFPVRAFATLPH
ncbi:kynurenine formamidase [Deinococcus carri]|uniref:Kynurenine formamidase n=1 Tax=Deinococcus carri TaxID=1211323 RepID=A0ABP9W8A9_9DEIO